MTTFESFKKFGLGMRGIMGGILMIVGSVVTVLGLVVAVVDRVTGNFGLVGVLLVFIGTGLVALFSGLRMFLRDKKKTDGLREAYENNRCIMADIVGIREETSSKPSGDNMFTGVSYRNYYVIECHYKDPVTGTTHIYYSPALYYDPNGLIIAKQVPVYIDRDDEKNFFVDIDKALAPVELHTR